MTETRQERFLATQRGNVRKITEAGSRNRDTQVMRLECEWNLTPYSNADAEISTGN